MEFRSTAAPFSKVPRHVVLIIDGSVGRAATRCLPLFESYKHGVEALRNTIDAAIELGISFLTVHLFSLDGSWSHPEGNPLSLSRLLHGSIRNNLEELRANNIRVRVIGAPIGAITSLLRAAERDTRANTRLTLLISFGGDARQDIAAAARSLGNDVQAGRLDPADISVDTIAARLDTAGIPDPDLIIRTAGEQCLSNILLWQAAYAEFVFLPINWPDFDRAAFERAIADYAHRERRFGGLGASGHDTKSMR